MVNSFLSFESVSTTQWPLDFIWKRGELESPGVIFSKYLIARTGQISLLFRYGIFKILILFLNWRVLDHFTSTFKPGGGGGKEDIPSGELIKMII